MLDVSKTLREIGQAWERRRHRPPGSMWDALGDFLSPNWKTSRFYEMIREAQEKWHELGDEASRRREARRLRIAIFLRASRLVFARVSVEALLALIVEVGQAWERLRRGLPGSMWDALGDFLSPNWKTSRFYEMIREAQEKWHELGDEASRRREARRLRIAIFLRASRLVFARVSVEVLLAFIVAMILGGAL